MRTGLDDGPELPRRRRAKAVTSPCSPSCPVCADGDAVHDVGDPCRHNLRNYFLRGATEAPTTEALSLYKSLAMTALSMQDQEYTDDEGKYAGHTSHPVLIPKIALRLIQEALDAARLPKLGPIKTPRKPSDSDGKGMAGGSGR